MTFVTTATCFWCFCIYHWGIIIAGLVKDPPSSRLYALERGPMAPSPLVLIPTWVFIPRQRSREEFHIESAIGRLSKNSHGFHKGMVINANFRRGLYTHYNKEFCHLKVGWFYPQYKDLTDPGTHDHRWSVDVFFLLKYYLIKWVVLVSRNGIMGPL